MSKHTPGPWKGYKDQGVYAGDDEGVIVFETGCGCCTESKLTQSDANLIASSPDLLEALKDVMYWDNGKPEWEAARAAIAKATGENQ